MAIWGAKGAVGAFMALATSGGGAVADDPLAAYRWTSRVLVVAAPSASDASYRAQRAALDSERSSRAERDLVTVEAVGRSAGADALRRRFGVPEGVFRAVLIGKDGGVKLSSDEPIPLRKLFSTIDAMPMRQNEMRRR